MKHLGAIVLSFEEAGDLNGILPWKTVSSEDGSFDAIARTLRAELPVTGLLHVSTCNRVEIIYSLGAGIGEMNIHERVRDRLLGLMPVLDSKVQPLHLVGRDVIRHLIRLACGLESMVLGETEIRAQLKDAHTHADDTGNLDRRLRIVLRHVFQEAREIRSRLPLANLPLSVSALATRRLADMLHNSDPKDAVVIIGSGPMSRAAAEYVAKWDARIVLVNRTLSKVQEQADRLGAQTLTLDEFLSEPERAGSIRAIITATSRPDAFLTREFVEPYAEKGIVLVDMAVPPDVDPAAISMPGVRLVNMESLRAELVINRARREEAAREAEAMIHEALFRTEAGLAAGLSGGSLREIQENVRTKSRAHLEQLLEDRLRHLSQKDRRLIYTWAIQANRDMNRIHRQGLESVIREYIAAQYS